MRMRKIFLAISLVLFLVVPAMAGDWWVLKAGKTFQRAGSSAVFTNIYARPDVVIYNDAQDSVTVLLAVYDAQVDTLPILKVQVVGAISEFSAYFYKQNNFWVANPKGFLADNSETVQDQLKSKGFFKSDWENVPE